MKAAESKNTDSRCTVVHRLKIAKGHLEKVIQMAEKHEYCIDILTQSQAVQAALKNADAEILENHLKTCVVDAITGNRKDQAISEVMKVFNKSNT
jgi:CsoR family transcriptional regulator, copper-sensing transcriptional repressor